MRIPLSIARRSWTSEQPKAWLNIHEMIPTNIESWPIFSKVIFFRFSSNIYYYSMAFRCRFRVEERNKKIIIIEWMMFAIALTNERDSLCCDLQLQIIYARIPRMSFPVKKTNEKWVATKFRNSWEIMCCRRTIDSGAWAVSWAWTAATTTREVENERKNRLQLKQNSREMKHNYKRMHKINITGLSMSCKKASKDIILILGPVMIHSTSFPSNLQVRLESTREKEFYRFCGP